MPSFRLAECLVFVVRIAEAPDRAKTNPNSKGLSGYILTPNLGREFLEPLLLLTDRSQFQLLASNEECPQELAAAAKNDLVAIKNFHIDLQHLQSTELHIVSQAVSWCKLLREIFPSRQSDYTREYRTEDADWSPVAEQTQSVFRDEACMRFISRVVEVNPNIPYWNREGTTFLHLAVFKRCVPLVQLLLKHGAKTDIRKSDKCDTVLHTAMRSRESSSIFRLLLEHGANPNAASKGDSPLQFVLRGDSRSVDELKLLLDHGADVNVDFEPGAIQLAARRGSEFLACVLSFRPDLSIPRNKDALRAFLKGPLKGGDEKKLDLFFENGFDLAPEDASDTQLFFSVIQLARHGIVERLLEWGASVRERVAGLTALHVAAKHAGADSVRLLLDHGADLNARSSTGKTPLALAIFVGNVEAAKCLLARGPDLEGLLHEAAVTYAAPRNTVEIVRALVEAGADVNASHWTGRAPIAEASRLCRVEVVEELMRHGARLDFGSEAVRDDLRTAIELESLSAVEFYLKNGVQLKGGVMEAVEVAVFAGRHAMVPFFLELDDSTLETTDVLEKVETVGRLIGGEIMPSTVGKDILEYGYLRLDLVCKVLARCPSWCFKRGRLAGSTDVVWNHVRALMAADLTVNQREKCELPVGVPEEAAAGEGLRLEVRSMKATKIGDSDVTFYDVLDSSLSEVARLLRNDGVVRVLEGGGFGEGFPAYVGMIAKRFRKAVFRKTLAERGVRMLEALCAHLPELPLEVREKIVGYLDNRNLYVLTNVVSLKEVGVEAEECG
uniref:Transient receptor potential A n=1 Tax=Bemisia tabaci TaxID=7038 RepID=A0AA51ZUJ9_BEMTA|nr:transient receptor potential A [Bemisia tabaci]